jgi:hypothetical protein
VLGRQEPKARHVAGYLISQQLANASFNAETIEFFAPISSKGPERFQFDGWPLRMKLVEFFFAVRTGQ